MRISRPEAEAEVQRLLGQGQAFLAYDLAQASLAQFPDSVTLRQAEALALLRAGALGEARAVLEIPVLVADVSEETLGLRARVLKEVWKQTGAFEDARRARDAYLQAFRASQGVWTGINAATLSWIVGEHSHARHLAGQVLDFLQKSAADGSPPLSDDTTRFWRAATRGEALLLLGRDADAEAAYIEAASLAGHRYASLTTTRQQLNLLADAGFPVPPSLTQRLHPPALVVFAGHMLDRPDRLDPRFPAARENEVRQAIAAQLDRMDAQIGYCSAACGSDILFLEAMQARGAEINIVLPYAQADFLQTSVSFAGPGWVTRFHQALEAADTVRYVTEESVSDDSSVFGIMGQILLGCAALRGQSVEAEVRLLAVWDGQPSALPGGTADLVAQWPDPKRLHVIPLTTPPAPTASIFPSEIIGSPVRRRIKTLLFADVVGYSRLQENRTPAFMFSFLSRVAEHLPHIPSYVNTWGDAIFAIMDDASSLAEYALSLQEVVCDTDWAEFGLPGEMSVRIGLHAGPVFEGLDPITRMTNYYGSHVNRASRLEAVTVPGNVYASEQFAALLTAEQQTAEHRTQQAQGRWQPQFACQYVGILALSKNYGHQATYHLRRSKASARTT